MIHAGKIQTKMAKGRQIRNYLGVARGPSGGVYLGDKYKMSFGMQPRRFRNTKTGFQIDALNSACNWLVIVIG